MLALAAPVAIGANLLVGRDPFAVRAAVRQHAKKHAQVLALQEAGGYLPQVAAVAARHGYQEPIHAPAKAGRGMDSSVLLVRDDVPVHATGTALVRAPWTGPRRGIVWPGRGIPWAIVDLTLGGRVYRTLVASIHGPTGRLAGNRRAWRRYLRRLRRMARRLTRRYGATDVLFIGDWNCPADADDRTSVRQLLADRIGAQIVRTGAAIDYAVTTLPIRGRRGPARGSDHPSTRYMLAA